MSDFYPTQLLASIYRIILFITKGRGEHTLARIDSSLLKLNRSVKIGNGSDLSIVLPPDSHFFRYLIKSHERHVSNAIDKLVKLGDTVVDIGANIGYFSAYASAAVGKNGKVLAIEPEAENFKYLQTNCNLINESGFNCSPYNLAVSSANGETTLNIHKYSTYHTLENEFSSSDKIESQQVVQMVKLDDWAKDRAIDKISFLKIDTEGHEPKVLEGATQLFESGAVDCVIMECRANDLANFIDAFAHKFNLYQLTWNGNEWKQEKASSLDYKTECLLSKYLILPESLC
jgi:FkbM family methyltransferase